MIERTRGLDFFNPDRHIEDRHIEIIGAGGIGSPLAECLATMGFDLTIWDEDIVEAHNISNQNYYPDQIGQIKVKALLDTLVRKVTMPGDTVEYDEDSVNNVYKAKIIDKDNPNSIQSFVAHNAFFDRNSKITGSVLVFATDSIESRTLAYRVAKESYEYKKLPHTIIDGRLGGEYYQVFYVDMTDNKSRKAYEKTLFEPENAVELPCTGKSIMYIASAITGQMAYYIKEAVINSGRVHSECVIDFTEQINIFNGCIVAFGGDNNV